MKIQREQLIVVWPEELRGELTPEGKAQHDLMHSDEVKELLGLHWAPSILQDPTYPDVLIIWDHGEGPHCPKWLPSPEGWREGQAVPQALWNLATKAVHQAGLREDYAFVWLRAEETE